MVWQKVIVSWTRKEWSSILTGAFTQIAFVQNAVTGFQKVRKLKKINNYGTFNR